MSFLLLLFEAGQEQFFLVAEQLVEGTFRHGEAMGYGVHCDGLDAFLMKRRYGYIDNAVAEFIS